MTEEQESIELQLLRAIRADQLSTKEELNNLSARSYAQGQDIEYLKKAFPDGDCEGHQRYHAGIIEFIELRNKLIRDCLYTMSKGAVIVSLLALCRLLWELIKIQVHK